MHTAMKMTAQLRDVLLKVNIKTFLNMLTPFEMFRHFLKIMTSIPSLFSFTMCYRLYKPPSAGIGPVLVAMFSIHVVASVNGAKSLSARQASS